MFYPRRHAIRWIWSIICESCYHLRELLLFTRVIIIYESCQFTEFVVVLLELLTFYGDYRHLTGIIVILRGLLLGWKVLG